LWVKKFTWVGSRCRPLVSSWKFERSTSWDRDSNTKSSSIWKNVKHDNIFRLVCLGLILFKFCFWQKLRLTDICNMVLVWASIFPMRISIFSQIIYLLMKKREGFYGMGYCECSSFWEKWKGVHLYFIYSKKCSKLYFHQTKTDFFISISDLRRQFIFLAGWFLYSVAKRMIFFD